MALGVPSGGRASARRRRLDGLRRRTGHRGRSVHGIRRCALRLAAPGPVLMCPRGWPSLCAAGNAGGFGAWGSTAATAATRRSGSHGRRRHGCARLLSSWLPGRSKAPWRPLPRPGPSNALCGAGLVRLFWAAWSSGRRCVAFHGPQRRSPTSRARGCARAHFASSPRELPCFSRTARVGSSVLPRGHLPAWLTARCAGPAQRAPVGSTLAVASSARTACAHPNSTRRLGSANRRTTFHVLRSSVQQRTCAEAGLVWPALTWQQQQRRLGADLLGLRPAPGKARPLSRPAPSLREPRATRTHCTLTSEPNAHGGAWA